MCLIMYLIMECYFLGLHKTERRGLKNALQGTLAILGVSSDVLENHMRLAVRL